LNDQCDLVRSEYSHTRNHFLKGTSWRVMRCWTFSSVIALDAEEDGSHLVLAGAPSNFGPGRRAGLLSSIGGGNRSRVQSRLHAAARVKRLPLWTWPLALFPDRFPSQGKRPWSRHACSPASKPPAIDLDMGSHNDSTPDPQIGQSVESALGVRS
jgi:hypothetical protein